MQTQTKTFSLSFGQLISKLCLISMLFIGLSQSSIAQDSCDHLLLDYSASTTYYSIGVKNPSQEETKWYLEITKAPYKLDENLFKNAEGIKLSVELRENANGTFDYVITPDQTIQSNQSLSFIYDGVPDGSIGGYKEKTNLVCSAATLDRCNHLELDYNVSSLYYALAINNTRLEESKWYLEIFEATYKLDENLFKNSNGVKLSVELTENANGTFDYLITPDQTIKGYQYLNFIYDGVPESSNGNYRARTNLVCSYNYSALCENLKFNYFNESQYSFGFSVQNENSVAYHPYEIHIDNATYKLDPDQLKHDGFDFLAVDNGDNTFDYYFLAQEPIEANSSSPEVRSSQDHGTDIKSSGQYILCDDDIVSSGLNGGLESHGGLASKIALRNFKRALSINTAPAVKIDNTIISELAPTHILAGDELVESSPTDLVDITIADAIWAGDYSINGSRYASIFGSKTNTTVYDHTKAICDRVKGSELVAVEVIKIKGYELILSTIRRPNNMTEHAISFSLAYEEHGDFTMASHWAIDEYPESTNFLNYQVWTNSKAKSIAAVQHIINNVTNEKGHTIKAAVESPTAPKLFARRAQYRLGAFYLELNNALTIPTTVQISGACMSKEVDGEVLPYNEEIEVVPGQTSLKLELPFGNIFDGQVSIITEDNQKDVIYLADGAWGLEYNEFNTSVTQLEIIPENRTEENDEYLVERGISVAGNTETYISIFKQLIPGGLAVDLSEYNTMSFDSQREGVFEVTLLTADNTDPTKNFSHTLKAEAGKSVDIPFTVFSNADRGQIDQSQITTIYIAFKEANNEGGVFDFSIENIRFRNKEESEQYVRHDKLNIYPNPAEGAVNLTHTFTGKSEAEITVYDTKGVVVKRMTTTVYKGLHTIPIRFNNNEEGLHFISLKTPEGYYSNAVLLK